MRIISGTIFPNSALWIYAVGCSNRDPSFIFPPLLGNWTLYWENVITILGGCHYPPSCCSFHLCIRINIVANFVGKFNLFYVACFSEWNIIPNFLTCSKVFFKRCWINSNVASSFCPRVLHMGKLFGPLIIEFGFGQRIWIRV